MYGLCRGLSASTIRVRASGRNGNRSIFQGRRPSVTGAPRVPPGDSFGRLRVSAQLHASRFSSPATDERESFISGVEWLEREVLAQAIARFKEAVRRNEKDICARLGMAPLQLRQYESSFARYVQAMQLASPFVRVRIYLDRGNVKTELHQYSAKSDFDAATRLGCQLGDARMPQTAK